MGKVIHLVSPTDGGNSTPVPLFFTRAELDAILNVYARMVSIGEWKDYSFETGPHSVAFAIYKRHRDVPVFRIEKRPKAKKNGPYILSEPSGIVRYGRELQHVLDYFKAKKFLKLQS